ncbi:MAG TPA: 6-carboxytetrahydropterin synthase [Candidatus Limnocylindrales bacterium]|nr:6-carboxytetrahydropterin synthase [Candidatus Limnocylindrales bacterium]
MSATVPPQYRAGAGVGASPGDARPAAGHGAASSDATGAESGGPSRTAAAAGHGPPAGERPAVAGHYEVFVSKDSFKFNAAHFIAYPGFRERLHGHNYRVSVRLEGPVGGDGYVVDFGEIKRAATAVCRQLNERVIVPMQSDVLAIERDGGQVILVCEDGARFSFPEDDCALLEIRHSSAEELAAFICLRLRAELPLLAQRGVAWLQVGVAEAPNQEARYRIDL